MTADLAEVFRFYVSTGRCRFCGEPVERLTRHLREVHGVTLTLGDVR